MLVEQWGSIWFDSTVGLIGYFVCGCLIGGLFGCDEYILVADTMVGWLEQLIEKLMIDDSIDELVRIN